MEANGFESQLNILSSRIQVQKTAIIELECILEDGIQETMRRDHLLSIDGVSLTVDADVSRLTESESRAKDNETKSVNAFDLASSCIGIATCILGDPKAKESAKSFALILNKRRPTSFGNIMIGFRFEPPEIKAFSISALARDYKANELWAIQKLGTDGYKLVTKERFHEIVETLKANIASGRIKLPINIETEIIRYGYRRNIKVWPVITAVLQPDANSPR